jgi:hypothetical protein
VGSVECYSLYFDSFMLFSSSSSLDALVNLVSIKGYSEVRSIFAVSASEYSERETGVVTTAAYGRLNHRFQVGREHSRIHILPH